MAIIQTTAKDVTNQQAADFRDAVCDVYRYPATIRNPAYTPGGQEPQTIPNPVSRAAFAQAKLDEFVWAWGRNLVTNHKRKLLPPIGDVGL